MKGNIFIKRPVLAISISILLLVVGFISLLTLPVEQYPNIAPPTINVSASYPGADAGAVQSSVVMPLEEAINGVEHMVYMTSSAANNGSATITIYFEQGTNPDMAAVNVQNRVSRAQALLPAEVTQIGVTVAKQQSGFLQVGGLRSTDGRYDQLFIANYLNINVIPELQRIEGVGNVMSFGSAYSMRLWLKPSVMAQYGLMPSDISAALAQQNIVASPGSLGLDGDATYQYTLKYKGRLTDAEEYKNIVLRSLDDGSVLRLGDVAEVELGAVSYGFKGFIDGQPGTNFMVSQVAGANATEVNNRITKRLEELSKDLPSGLEFVTVVSSNDFLYASIYTVVETLIVAILLVILVVYFFLQDFKATIIPSISIIVSLIGTFLCLQLAGFSINILTLFALVLAIGTVVDDAIVVVEAVQAKFETGYKSAYLATRDAMGDVTIAIISCTLVFMAVFIPVTFMGGTAGTFYTQFGVTIATSVGLSMVSALTLCPALCALMMRPSDIHKREGSFASRVKQAYEVSFNATMGKYKKFLMALINRRWIAWVSLGGAVVVMVYLMATTKTGLVPQEDQGMIMVNVTTPAGSTLSETGKVMARVDSIIRAIPQVEHSARIDGFGLISGQGPSNGTFFVRLKPWGERSGEGESATAVLGRIMGAAQGIKEANIFAIQPGMIPGYGMGNAVDLNLQDRTGGDMGTFYATTMQFLMALNARPEIAMAYSSYAMNFPQYRVNVDAAQCMRAGIAPREVLTTLGAYLGGSYVSNFNQFGKVFRVMAQASPEDRIDETSLNNIFVRSSTGMAPISQFVTLERITDSESMSRFNLFSSISASVSVAEGYSTGEAMQAISEVASSSLPTGYSYEYGGISREESEQSSGQTVFIYGLCVLLIFLILAGLYESFLVPFAVILSVPFGLMGSFLFANIWGFENNIYLQTGVIMLIGLLAKTAILITEYASERRRQGMGIVEAAYSAAQARLRPILMTVATMVIGMLPLMFASGAGANGNSSLGTGVVGGMVVGTLALLFVVPVFFITFQYLQERFVRTPEHHEIDPQIELERQRSLQERSAFNKYDTTNE